MHLNYLALAVPLLTGLMILEFFIAKRKGKNIFNFTNSIAKILASGGANCQPSTTNYSSRLCVKLYSLLTFKF
jgi:hypothetical protein